MKPNRFVILSGAKDLLFAFDIDKMTLTHENTQGKDLLLASELQAATS